MSRLMLRQSQRVRARPGRRGVLADSHQELVGCRRLDEDDRAEIWRLHAAGHNTNEISKAVGRAYATVAALLKDAGGIRPATPTVPSSPRRLSTAEREEISRGPRARETFTVIAERIGRCPSTVSREVARNGGRPRY
jgi:IS30 family transposase